MKIVSIGAALMDQMAEVLRFPREDDEVFVPKLRLMPGGSAANTAVLCSRLGLDSGFIGKVGQDQTGDSLIEDFEREGVDTGGISRSKLPTGTVFVAVRSDGQRMMFAHSGAANDLSESDINLAYLGGFDHLHIADLENLKVLEYAAKSFEGSVSLNAGALIAEKGENALGLIGSVDIIVCSEDEAEKITQTEGPENCIRAMQKIGPKVVVITRGPKPTIASDGEKTEKADVFKVPAVDTTGAGDAFTAGFLVSYLETKDIKDAITFGNAVASSVIQHKGARSGIKNKSHVEEIPEIEKI